MITLVTYASLSDTFGRWLAGQVDLVPKRHYFISTIIRGMIFTAMWLFTFFGVYTKLFSATWYLVISLFFFASTYGYWITIGFKYGSDASVGD